MKQDKGIKETPAMPNIKIKTEKPDDDSDNNNTHINNDELNGNDGHGVFDYQAKKLQLRRHPYATTLHEPLREGGKTIQKSPAGKRDFHPLQAPPLGARCGEIFVANNANKWTFVCTFCNKTTRDIGNFVLHAAMHLQEQQQQHNGNSHKVPEDNEVDDEDVSRDDFMETAVASGNRSSINDDYLDCGSYLDVNVHTDPGDLSLRYEEHQQQATTNPVLAELAATPTASTTTTLPKKRLKKDVAYTSTPNHVVEKLPSKKETTANRSSPWSSQPFSEIGGVPSNAIHDGQHEDLSDGDDDEDNDDNQVLDVTKEQVAVDMESSSAERPKRRQIRGPAYCDLCDKTFQYYSLYRNHMIKHSNETPFKCDLCQKGFKSKQALRYHAQTHKRDNELIHQYVSQNMTHEIVAAYPCIVCGHTWPSLKERDIHMETHSKDRPFHCDICGKYFRLRHHLSNHLRMHRRYRCDFCKTDFTSAIHLLKPYACGACSQLPDVVLRISDEDAGDGSPAKKEVISFSGDEQMDGDDDAVYDSGGGGAEETHDNSVTDNELMLTDSFNNRSRSTVDVPPRPDRSRYNCKHCPRTYSHVNGLNYHMRKKHPAV